MPALIITTSNVGRFEPGYPSFPSDPSPIDQFNCSFQSLLEAPVQVNVAALKELEEIKAKSKAKNKTLNFIRGKYTTFK